MDALNAFVHFWNTALTWIMSAFVDLLWGVLYIVVDGLLTVVSGFVSLIDISTVVEHLASSWGLLPAQIVWIISGSGLAQCLAILGYAYLIRMIINLIPATFTRI
jgi:hypothetical protein